MKGECKLLATTLCYIEHNGCYLMLHRISKANDPNQDKWIGVGGKFEEGESPEECVLRENQRGDGTYTDQIPVSRACDLCLPAVGV